MHSSLRSTTFLTAMVVGCIWLPYSTRPLETMPGILPLLALMAVVTPLFAAWLSWFVPGTGGRYGAFFGAAWYGLHPAHAALISDRSHLPVLWFALAIAASFALWTWVPDTRTLGFFAVPGIAVAFYFRDSLFLHGWPEATPALFSVVAVAIAVVSAQFRHTRILTFALLWFALIAWVATPLEPVALAGIGLAIGWTLARLVGMMRRAELGLLALAAVGWLVIDSAEILQAARLTSPPSVAFDTPIAAAPAPLATPSAQPSVAQPVPVQPNRAAQVAGKSPTAAQLLDLSLVHYRARRYSEAIVAAKQALRLQPNYAEAYNNLAASYAELKQWDEAIDAAQHALILKPDFTLARNNLLWALDEKRRAAK